MIKGQEIYFIAQTSINEMLFGKYYTDFGNWKPQFL